MTEQLQSAGVLTSDEYSLLWTVEYCGRNSREACGFNRLAGARTDEGDPLGRDRSLLIDELVARGWVDERCFIGMVEYTITPSGLELLQRDATNHPRRDVVNGMVIVRL